MHPPEAVGTLAFIMSQSSPALIYRYNFEAFQLKHQFLSQKYLKQAITVVFDYNVNAVQNSLYTPEDIW